MPRAYKTKNGYGMIKVDINRFSDEIRRAIKDLGITQYALSQEVKCSQSVICKVLQKQPTEEWIFYGICDALGLEPEDYLTKQDKADHGQ